MTRVLFICHGNICRSPIAEFILKDMVKKAGYDNEFHIASAATSTEEIGNDIYSPAKRVLQEHGIPFKSRRARQVSLLDYREFDMLVCMDRNNYRNLMRILGSDPQSKARLLLDYDVADPWYTGDFEKAFCDIKKGCEALLKEKASH